MKKIFIFLLILLAGLGVYMWRHSSDNMPHMSGERHMMDHNQQSAQTYPGIIIPDSLSEVAENGKSLFDANCAVCHGQNALGNTGKGPPLVHKIYEPSHHADESFQRAVASGVLAHHWPFGNMPPIPGISRDDTETIISYIRELQRANGIN